MVDHLIGEVLDEKYRLEKKLGQGGMGAVFLATHLGTERPVALKLIVPQYMANEEFVERFKREARAAGRLRHPNVVNVTDFGFAHTHDERFAYLVMEYLDGCALADILSEEQRLPLGFAVDILEQVCAAVGEAHEHGIIHRDLKPDNIWLEPNRRGGYTVKVLDFGLAKLRDPAALTATRGSQATASPRSSLPNAALQVAGDDETTLILTRADGPQPVNNRASNSGNGVTRAGSVMGTPLYMSPEQCRGEELDERADIYSLGVIAYQMLAGRTPFTGTVEALIKQHKESAPPPIGEYCRDIPKAVAAVIMSTLAKAPAARPESVSAFVSALRATADNTGTLLRRAVTLYSEHFPTFMRISLRSYIPALASSAAWLLNELLILFGIMPIPLGEKISICFGTALSISGLFANAINSGIFVPVVAQLMLAPLHPVQLGSLFNQFKKRFRAFVASAIPFYLITFVMISLLVAPFLLLVYGYSMKLFFAAALLAAPFALACFSAYVNYLLFVPVVMLEAEQGRRALERSKRLVARARRSMYSLLIIYFAVPFVGLISRIFSIKLAVGLQLSPARDSFFTLFAPMIGALTGLFSVIAINLFNPLVAIVIAMLYLKARQAGGDTLKEALGEELAAELTKSRWNAGLRERIHLHIQSSR